MTLPGPSEPAVSPAARPRPQRRPPARPPRDGHAAARPPRPGLPARSWPRRRRCCARPTDEKPAHLPRQRHRHGRHGDVRRQPDRAGRQDGGVRQRLLRPAHDRRGRPGRRGGDGAGTALGRRVRPQPLRETLQKVRPKVLGIVHAETSTGAWQPLEGLGALCHEFDTLLIVDAVTSLGCVPVEVDAWGLDAVYSCSQKGLSCPPGLSPVTFSPRAVEAIKRRKTKVQSWYLDMTMIQHYWDQDHSYHHTAPITMIYALREGLCMLHEEGLEARWARHLRNHQALKAGLNAPGPAIHGRGRASVAAAQRGAHPGRRGRRGGAQAAADGVRHRDRRRPRRLQGQGVAHRPDGPQQPAEQRAAVPGGAGAVPRTAGARRPPPGAGVAAANASYSEAPSEPRP